MAKKYRQQQNQHPRLFKTAKGRLIALGVVAVIIAGIGYLSYNSLIPTNGSAPVIGIPSNHFIKATHNDKSGFIYVSQSSGSVKGLKRSGGGSSEINPTYTFGKGDLVSIHVVSEDYDTHSKHNFNVNEFNVHTRDLGYFETQTATFSADKTGTFEYYCTIHPEMRGKIIIEE